MRGKCTLHLISFLFALNFLSVYYAQTSGGPDNFGYTWFDSNDPNGPTYNWVDITSNGTLVTGINDDNSIGPISIPDFVYYGYIYNQIKIGSNGWISFNNIGNIAHCFPSIPSSGGPGDNFIAPYMTDLNFLGASNTGEIYYYNDLANNRFIISYINAPFWVNANPDYTGSNTFQVILSTSDSTILFQYNTMESTFNDETNCTSDVSIGIENYDGTDGLIHSSEIVPTNNYAILFDPPNLCRVSDLTTSLNGTTISANVNNAIYQWLDCNNNYSQINGETNQTFTPTINGNYAVRIIDNGCIGTSTCVNISTVGIEDLDNNLNLNLYPNPTNGVFLIEFNQIQKDVELEILNIRGEVIYDQHFKSIKKKQFDLNKSAGCYFISVITSNGKRTMKLLID